MIFTIIPQNFQAISFEGKISNNYSFSAFETQIMVYIQKFLRSFRDWFVGIASENFLTTTVPGKKRNDKTGQFHKHPHKK